MSPHIAYIADPNEPNKENPVSDPNVLPPVEGTEHGLADPSKVSPKVLVSTLLAVIVPAAIALVTYIGAHQEVLGIDNVLAGVFISALIPGILTFLGGYLVNDPARNG